MAQVKPGSDLVVPKVRKAFPDTAYWNADVHTGADGHARVDIQLPRRADHVAHDDSRYDGRRQGRRRGDARAGAQKPDRRLAAPRFFRQGDETVLRVIAHNYLATAKDVTFALDVSGVDVLSGQTQKVTIPAKGESYVDWRVKAQRNGQRDVYGQGADQRRVGRVADDAAGSAVRREAKGCGRGRSLFRCGAKPMDVQLLQQDPT